MKIKEYPKITSLESTDTLIVDTNDGTKSIEFGDIHLKADEITLDPAISHRNTYRGKNLGTSFTDEQKAAIEDGTFEDLYVGDYWVDGTIQWIIMDINYPILPAIDNPNNTGHYNSLTIVPRDILYNSAFNNTANNTGYGNSTLRSTGLIQAKNMINSFFGSENIYVYTENFVTENATTLPHASGWANRIDCSVEILNMPLIFGEKVLGSSGTANSSTGYDAGSNLPFIKLSQSIPIIGFSMNPKLIGVPVESGNRYYWIEEPFMYSVQYQMSISSDASGVFHIKDISNKQSPNVGVRPFFHIHG